MHDEKRGLTPRVQDREGRGRSHPLDIAAHGVDVHLLEMMYRVLGQLATLGIDHETSLVVTLRLQAALHAFTKTDVLRLQYLTLVIHRGALLPGRLRIR